MFKELRGGGHQFGRAAVALCREGGDPTAYGGAVLLHLEPKASTVILTVQVFGFSPAGLKRMAARVDSSGEAL